MRKQSIYSPTSGRDQGKRYMITEMPASVSEEWAGRLVFAMMNSGADIPDELAYGGLAGLAALNVGMLIKAIQRVPFDMARPLLEQMMECVQIMPDPKNQSVVRSLIEDDIEDVATRLMLRKEIFQLHLNFSTAAVQSPASAAAASTPA